MKTNLHTKKTKVQHEELTTWWGVKKTEAEHQDNIDNFYLTFVPKWFTFISWLLALGVLNYVETKTTSLWVKGIYAVSFIFLFMFLQTSFYNFPFYKVLPSGLLRSKRTAYLFSFVIAAALALFLQLYLLKHIIAELSIK